MHRMIETIKQIQPKFRITFGAQSELSRSSVGATVGAQSELIIYGIWAACEHEKEFFFLTSFPFSRVSTNVL